MIPKALGKSEQITKMSKEEIKDVHSRHKRQELNLQDAVKVSRKEDFEVNQEEDDDDFAGPKL